MNSLNTKKQHQRKQNSTCGQKQWFDNSLIELHKQLKLNSKLLQKYPNVPHIRHNFFTSLKRYNKQRKCKKRMFKQKILDNLDELREYNPYSYWNLLKKLRNDSINDQNTKISMEEWELYFKNFNKGIKSTDHDAHSK